MLRFSSFFKDSKSNFKLRNANASELNNRNLAVNSKACHENDCDKKNCHDPNCQLCLPCLSTENLSVLRQAYQEHMRQGVMKRVLHTL